MFKRITTVLLFGGLLGLVPAAARADSAAPAAVVQADPEPAGYDVFHSDEDHYRCMYRCDHHKRHYKKGDGRKYHRSYCWHYSKHHGWYKTRCGRHGGHHGHHDHGHGHHH